MKTITSAIRPRRRRLTNDSANAKPNTALRGESSKLSISEELPSRHLRRLHSGSTTTIESITAGYESTSGVYDHRDRSDAKRDLSAESFDYVSPADVHLNDGAASARPLLERSSSPSLYESMHHQPLYEDGGFDGVSAPNIRRRIKTAAPVARSQGMAASVDGSPRAVPVPSAVAGSIAESKSGQYSYWHRLPLHYLGFGRHSGGGSSSSRAIQSVPPESTGAVNSEDVGGLLFEDECLSSQQFIRESALLSESMIEPSNSSFFSVDYGLLKRVSSTPGNLSLFRAHLVDPFSNPEFRAPPRYTRHQPIRLPANEPDDTPLYGYALLALTSVLFMFSMYSLVVSKFMPDTGIAFLDAVKEDRYFCLLMPITGLSFTFAVFWNWLGMKLFRHSKGS
ncbi:hypothetical protein GGI21_003187 [Coemansia aciculifera]|nr:hypothetical protein GGI21_003187 [Coemansia aciculifera]